MPEMPGKGSQKAKKTSNHVAELCQVAYVSQTKFDLLLGKRGKTNRKGNTGILISGPSLLERTRNEQAELSLLGLVLIVTVDLDASYPESLVPLFSLFRRAQPSGWQWIMAVFLLRRLMCWEEACGS